MNVYSIISLFPESVEPYLNSSMLKRAQETIKSKGSKAGRKAVIAIQYENPRSYTKDKHKRVDQKPFAGGPGMVLSAEPVLRAAEKAIARASRKYKAKKVVSIFLTPSGDPFTNEMAKSLAKADHVLFLCGRYEGMDERVPQILKAKKVSIGPYVVTGGELPAAMMIDAIARQVPGVLGEFSSVEEMRTASPEVYTRPEVLLWKKKKHAVPKVLLEGDHKAIESWRSERLSRGGKSPIELLTAKVDALYKAQSPSRADWSDWLYQSHVHVVAAFAHRLARKYRADADSARAGAMLHDIADAVMSRFNPDHAQTSAQIARGFLKESGFADAAIDVIVDDAMACHGCKEGKLPQTLEGKIVATADAMAHLATNYYDLARQHLKKEGKSNKEIAAWISAKVHRDFGSKLLFEKEVTEMRPYFERLTIGK
jgi:tRNA (guanine37-N1)-methyltransferase